MSLLTLNVTKSDVIIGNATFRSAIGISQSFDIGDFNNDTYLDFAVGSPDVSAGDGKITILWGPLNLASLNVDNISLTKTVFLPASGSVKEFGYVVRNAGDINGDGIQDLISTSDIGDGAAYLWYGSKFPPTVVDIETFTVNTGVKFQSIAGGGSRLGAALLAGKDINGDGRPDIVLGAPVYKPSTLYDGIIYVVFGKNFSTSTVYLPALNGNDGYNITAPLNSNGELGFSLEALDFDNDGIAEIIGGAPYYNQVGGATYDGLVYIVKRGNSSLPTINAASAGNWNITAPLGSNMRFGSTFNVADITGDGRSEFTIGAQYFRSSDGAIISIFGNVSFGTYIDHGSSRKEIGPNLRKSCGFDN